MEPASDDSTEAPNASRLDPTLLRFARAHLTSRAHRAVFSVLAGGSDAWWSAAEVAAVTHADLHAIDVALRQLAAARIVQAAAGAHDVQYRWRLDLRSLAEPAASATPVDPVCGMPVPADSPYRLDDETGLHRFCSLRCMTAARRAARG